MRGHRSARAALALLLLALATLPAWSEEAGFAENSGVRGELAGLIEGSTRDALAARTGVYRQDFPPLSVRFRVLRQHGDFYLAFSNAEGGAYPIDGKGSYVIERSLADGSFVQVKIFLNGDPDSFARIRPAGDRSVMDISMYGFPMYQGLMIPLRFKNVLTDPFEKIMALCDASVDWSLVFPSRPLPEDGVVRSMVDKIRAELPKLSDHDDGAMNAAGKFVYIRTLRALSGGGFNCSGFDKWVMDGLYGPRTGHLISIEALKKKHLDLRGTPSSGVFEGLDPYFGLDWTRNLALAVDRLDDPEAGPEDADVRDIPFFHFERDSGYDLGDLRFILYELAVRNPGDFYLGSVNHELPEQPGVREHSHVVVLFPYFGPDGRFEVDVMERNLETGIASLQRRYPGNFILLEKIRASRNFSPPKID